LGFALYCEMCGAPIIKEAYKIRIESSTLTVCKKCYSRASTAPGSSEILSVQAPGGSRPKAAAKYKTKRQGERYRVERDVVDDYPTLVRRAREKLGLTTAELAVRVREKETVIKRIESGKLRPTLDLAKRLEKALGIKLIEQVSSEEKPSTIGESGKPELTLGDLANIVIRDRGES